MAKKKVNQFTKKVKLRDVLDDKQSFKLKSRISSPEYNVQRKEGGMIIITSKRSGLTFSKKGTTVVYVKDCK